MCDNVNCKNHAECSRIEKEEKTERMVGELRKQTGRGQRMVPTNSEIAKLIKTHSKTTGKKTIVKSKKSHEIGEREVFRLPTGAEITEKIIKATTKKPVVKNKKDVRKPCFFRELFDKKGRKFLPDQSEIVSVIKG